MTVLAEVLAPRSQKREDARKSVNAFTRRPVAATRDLGSQSRLQ